MGGVGDSGGEGLRDAIVGERTVYEGRAYDFVELTLRQPDGTERGRPIVRHRGAVVVVPVGGGLTYGVAEAIDFSKELRRDEDLSVGRLDSRFTGKDRDSSGQGYDFDPSYAAIQGPYTAAINHYLRNELRYESEWTYEILTGRVHPWSYDNVENSYLNVAETLRREMSRNRNLQVYVANGYYDLATPYFATHYTFDHLSMDREYRERVTMGHFECGHMMYIRLADLAALREDLVAFYGRSLGR